MEKSKKTNKLFFIILCVILNITLIAIGPLTFQVRFLVMGFIIFFGGIYLMKNNPFENKSIGKFLIFGPFSLLFYGGLVYAILWNEMNNYLGVPLDIITFTSTVLAFMFYKKSNRIIAWFGAFYIILLSAGAVFLPNYYIWKDNEDNSISGKEFPELTIYNEKRELVDLKKQRGKTVVLDVWNSACGVCIEKFPEFERLKNEFAKDASIVFYALNLPLERDDKEPYKYVKRHTEPYSFEKLYADTLAQKKLNIDGVPQVIIIDKNSTVKYVGTLNMEKTEFYNNFYTLIEEIHK